MAKGAKGFMHPKVGGLKSFKQSTIPNVFKSPANPFRKAKTAVTKVTGGKTKPMEKF